MFRSNRIIVGFYPGRDATLRPGRGSALACVATVLLLVGCAAPRFQSPPPQTDGEPPGPAVAVTTVQYAPSTAANIGYNTLEVYLENRGRHPVTFTGGMLDGLDLPSLDAGALERLEQHFRFDFHGEGAAPPLAVPLPPPDPRVTWWQFYPSPQLAPGETVVCRINLTRLPTHTQSLTLRDAAGGVWSVPVPRFHQPPARITAVTWENGFERMFVQYEANGAEPLALRVNHHPVSDFILLRPAAPGLPALAAFAPPMTIRRGDPVDIALDFGNGLDRRVLLRALSGIMLDAPYGWRRDLLLPEPLRLAYGLDADPAITYLPIDVACGDTRARHHGTGAASVIDARLGVLRDRPDRLSGVEFCTAIYRSIWNIYAPIADAVFIKPYQLHWGSDATRFIELEEARIETARAAAAPRPVVWVPERYKRERHIEGEELSVMAWMALAGGVKGIRYHFWMNDVEAPFAAAPGLGESMQALNAQIKRLEPILGPLVPVNTRLDRPQRLKIYESWSGDAGILLLVRNMNYRTDARPNDNGSSPRFRVEPRNNVTVALDLPPWVEESGEARDLLREEALPTRREGSRISISIPRIEALRLIWIENSEPTNP